eukprot:TRINITY_DN41527_c0_g2_i2.p1 TRINITY_DN41527_c0_g2~~TRINITY_DN41527_c0_g2_i2.p1  ORF type:complete len:577 (-),score=51.83 TRINITY_DN41527_c0_g2_i2:317-1987(-)
MPCGALRLPITQADSLAPLAAADISTLRVVQDNHLPVHGGTDNSTSPLATCCTRWPDAVTVTTSAGTDKSMAATISLDSDKSTQPNPLCSACKTPRSLRGVLAADLLAGFGTFLRRTPDTLPPSTIANIHQQAKRCNRVDVFLSHRWKASGLQKYMAVLFEFYALQASAIALVASALCRVACELGGVYDADTTLTLEWTIVPPFTERYSFLCMIVGQVALFLAFVLLPLFDRRTVFVDYLSIDQGSEESRHSGAMDIANYLYSSRKLVLLWEPGYFTRMWCSFEVATFMAVVRDHCEGDKDITQYVTAVPLLIPTAAYVVQFALYCAFVSLAINWSEASSIGEVLLPCFTFNFPCHACLSFVAIRYSRNRETLMKQMAEYDVVNADCREAVDRSWILESIELRYGSLDAFNLSLQRTVKAACKELFRPTPSYKAVLFMTLSASFWCMDVLPNHLHAPVELRIAWGIVLIDVALCAVPLYVAFVFWMGNHVARACPSRSTFTLCCWTCGASLVVGTFIEATAFLPAFLLQTWGFLPLLLAVSTHIILVILCFTAKET